MFETFEGDYYRVGDVDKHIVELEQQLTEKDELINLNRELRRTAESNMMKMSDECKRLEQQLATALGQIQYLIKDQAVKFEQLKMLAEYVVNEYSHPVVCTCPACELARSIIASDGSVMEGKQ
jgi:uncharacterized protein Smg (DUF494 family)